MEIYEFGGAMPPSRDPVRRPGSTSFRVKSYSERNGRHMKCESMLECYVLRMFEVLSAVRSISEQPPRVPIKWGNQTGRPYYTADVFVEWENSASWLVEVKPKRIADLLTWKRKFHAIGASALAHGYHYVVVTDVHVKQAGMADVNRALEERHRERVLNLGLHAGKREPVPADLQTQRRVLESLASALRESPTYRALQQLGVADPAQWSAMTDLSLKDVNRRRYVARRLAFRAARGDE